MYSALQYAFGVSHVRWLSSSASGLLVSVPHEFSSLRLSSIAPSVCDPQHTKKLGLVLRVLHSLRAVQCVKHTAIDKYC